MGKIQRISEKSLEINFNSPQKEFSIYRDSFLQSDIGKIHLSIPWQELIQHFGIKEHRKGPSRIFSPKGMLALMFLKSYVGCSDRKLIEHLNGNIDFQLFCDILLTGKRITNYKIISEIRTFLGKRLNIKEAQMILSQYWKPHIVQSNIMLTDATCYETSMRYPTNEKLLWESILWSYGQLKYMCKYQKIRTPRTKYLKQLDRYRTYSRKRKRTIKEKRILTRSLLHLLNKILGLLEEIESQCDMPKKYYDRIKTVQTILKQQQEIFNTGSSVPDRIVSLAKSYIRPIVRGKEVKPVEFGAKVNMLQFDGINFIEHLSFSAFHEGNRLPKSIRYGRELVGMITHVSGDDIYATNANRNYCKKEDIIHGFKIKGKPGKYEDQKRTLYFELRKERATRMEGSFGTEKEYYGLKRIKARLQKNEELSIFFGVHTANAIKIAQRMAHVKNLEEVA